MNLWIVFWLACLFGTVIVFTWLSIAVSIRGLGELRELFKFLNEDNRGD